VAFSRTAFGGPAPPLVRAAVILARKPAVEFCLRNQYMAKVSDGFDFAASDEPAKGYRMQAAAILSCVFELERGGFD
jgi:hypothetical protein